MPCVSTYTVVNSQMLLCAGIPKFYRWLSERYPLLNQPTDVGETPLVDNLYLDMNGIIHNCTHGNDPGTKLTEEEMVVKIFGYLDKLFQVVKPQRLLFMAIDGDQANEATVFFPVTPSAFSAINMLAVQALLHVQR